MSTNKGYLIIEALIAVVILFIVVIAVFPTLNFLLRRTRRTEEETQANLYLQEGMEVAYNVCVGEWDLCLIDSYYPIRNEADPNPNLHHWELLPGTEPQLEAKYTRTITVSEVCRDTDGIRLLCTDAGANLDPDTRLITTTISWDGMSNPLSAELLLLKRLAR